MIKNIVKKISPLIPDKVYLKMQYRYHFRKKLDLINPKTFNEKIQWLKLYDRRPEYSKFVDKYAVREYIKYTIGEEYLIPLIEVYDNVEEIDWDVLPEKFVLKCTHGSTCNIICNDKSTLDIEDSKKKINLWMNQNWYWYGREWPYKTVKPRIICERYMVDESGIELKDYKFFCFNGKPEIMFIATDRGIDTRFDFYDMKFNHIPVMQHYKNSEKEIHKPVNFDKMVNLSRILSKGIPHIRVDFYSINESVYFGELTLYHFSGLQKFEPDEYDEFLGDFIELPLK